MEEIYKLISENLSVHWGTIFNSPSKNLKESLLYSLNAGGKRFRPLLGYATWRLFTNEDIKKILPFLSAIEMVHTYSLIHDDLPAMDDDVLRRGKPTNHVVYGEAMAILAGDALLTEAFTEMTSLSFEAKNVLKAINYFAINSGLNGMVGGQALDIENDGTDKIEESYLKEVNNYKTGCLIKISLVVPAILEGQSYEILEKIAEFFGLAFQLTDDVLGASSTTEELGKTANIDENRNIKTFVSIKGLRETKKEAIKLIDEAKDLIRRHYKNNALLIELADMIVNRVK